MTYTGVDSSGGGGEFPQHPKTGDWETLKGRMLSPVIEAPLESVSTGDSRHQDMPATLDWGAQILVTTGMTGGGGAMAK